MELSLPLPGEVELRIADEPRVEPPYPTARLQKGLLLRCHGRDLAEEGVGFGVPVLKRGVVTVFPGGMQLADRVDGPTGEITATYRMDLVERLSRPSGAMLHSTTLYAAKNTLAALHRRSPPLRPLLTSTSGALRRTLRLTTTYAQTAVVALIPVRYVVDGREGHISIEVDLRGVPCEGVTEVVVMNEQGARSFDAYEDTDGWRLAGEAIGTWDRVAAQTASFVCAAHDVAFSLSQAGGAVLLRGRELLGERVSWAGFGYSLPPGADTFAYEVKIGRAR